MIFSQNFVHSDIPVRVGLKDKEPDEQPGISFEKQRLFPSSFQSSLKS